MFTSTVGASIACQNVATRMWYGMARQGALPSIVGEGAPDAQDAGVAIGIQLVMALGLGLLVPALIGPDVTGSCSRAHARAGGDPRLRDSRTSA